MPFWHQIDNMISFQSTCTYNVQFNQIVIVAMLNTYTYMYMYMYSVHNLMYRYAIILLYIQYKVNITLSLITEGQIIHFSFVIFHVFQLLQLFSGNHKRSNEPKWVGLLVKERRQILENFISGWNISHKVRYFKRIRAYYIYKWPICFKDKINLLASVVPFGCNMCKVVLHTCTFTCTFVCIRAVSTCMYMYVYLCQKENKAFVLIIEQ